MKRTFQLFVVYIILFNISFAQTKELTIEDAVYKVFRGFYMDNYKQYNWRGNTDNITFTEKGTLNEMPANGKSKVILKIEDLNPVLKNGGFAEVQMFPAYSWIDDNNLMLNLFDGTAIYSLNNKQITTSFKNETDAENFDINDVDSYQAYTIKNNLFIKDKAGKITQITNDSDLGIVNGKSVHRQEFGINEGIFWSPKGNLLAFYRMDETMVTDYPLVNTNPRIAVVENTKYPMAGMKSHHVTVGIYNVATGKTTFLQTGEPAEQYLTNIAWEPDEKEIYIAVLNREQNHMWFNKYDAVSGKFIATLFEEKHDKYVEPLKPALFLKTKPEQFIWQSQRDGFNHLYLYNTSGKLIKQISKGEFVVLDILGFDKSEENVFVEATYEKRQIETHVYKINIATGEKVQITKEAGTHNLLKNFNSSMFIDSYSAIKVPSETNLLDSKGNILKSLNKPKDPLSDYKIGKLDVFTIKAADEKTDLFCATIKPADFDPNKKYPLILYVYGGPHAQMINDTWLGGQDLWKFYMAQKGYIVMVVDNRGSANRGMEFENVIHRNLGENEMADQLKAVNYLISTGCVDTSRIGVHGWSYGGFMTTSLMTNHPNIFKVGVAGGPVIDWKYYEVMYGERYMDTPDENPDGYANNSLLGKVDKLKGRLLIIHGAMDPTVVWQNSLAFIQKSIEEGKQVDYFVYPNAEHNVRGLHRVHLMTKITQYFDDFLMDRK